MNAVLLLVDLQQDYLAAPGTEPAAATLVAQAAALLDRCRKLQIPAVHIWTTIHRDGDDRRLPHWRAANRWECVDGTPGHQPPASLEPCDGETIVHKTGFNAFADAALEATLRRLRCDTVILAGLHLHACVRTAAVECLERGYRVCIAEDAVASNDPIHAAAARRWLAERCVEFAPASRLLARWEGRTAQPLAHYSPRCTEELLFEVPLAGPGEIAAAAGQVRDYWETWRLTPLAHRLEILEGFAKRLEAAAPEFARQMALEIGKPLGHGLEEARRAAGSARDVLERAANFQPQRREAAGLVRYRPLGVVAVITPWNNPVAIPAGKIVAALAYGNAVLWKPAPAATRIAQAMFTFFRQAGLPSGALQLLTGDHTTAQRLAADARVDAVTFTGSLHSGRSLQEICARRVAPLQAELNGNNAAILWEDAGLPDAAAQIAWGAFAFAGQRCTANRRVIVPAARFEDFFEALQRAAGRLVWDDPLQEAADLGPVISAAKRDETAVLVQTAQADRCVTRVQLVHQARAREPWAAKGAYAQPVILCCDQPDHPLVQEETMNPVLIVQRAEDFEHALALCNGVRYGLVAALFSPAGELQRRFLEQAQAGILKLNASTAGVDASLPFGGWKASSIGPPEHGEADRLFYTRMQAVYGTEKP